MQNPILVNCDKTRTIQIIKEQLLWEKLNHIILSSTLIINLAAHSNWNKIQK